jgi:hypothetical protein
VLSEGQSLLTLPLVLQTAVVLLETDIGLSLTVHMFVTATAILRHIKPIAPLLHPLVLAGVKQNYARRCKIPIDAITFDYTCMPPDTHPEAAPAEGGAYVSGMFVEGARWDPEAAQLAESQPKVRELCCCCCCMLCIMYILWISWELWTVAMLLGHGYMAVMCVAAGQPAGLHPGPKCLQSTRYSDMSRLAWSYLAVSMKPQAMSTALLLVPCP